jgi:hypothetical protein
MHLLLIYVKRWSNANTKCPKLLRIYKTHICRIHNKLDSFGSYHYQMMSIRTVTKSELLRIIYKFISEKTFTNCLNKFKDVLLYHLQQDQWWRQNTMMIKISKYQLQLVNVQKNPYKIMNIMYTTSTCTNGESDKLFHDTKRDILSSCTDFPTARYTETEIKEVMNYLMMYL